MTTLCRQLLDDDHVFTIPRRLSEAEAVPQAACLAGREIRMGRVLHRHAPGGGGDPPGDVCSVQSDFTAMELCRQTLVLFGWKVVNMLVLTRKQDQSIVIGSSPDMVTIKVVDIRYNTVRLGITAPGHIAVDREEVRAEKSRKVGAK